MIETSTLSIRRPFGKSLLISIFLLGVVIIMGEVAFRILPLKGKIPLIIDPHSTSPELEAKIQRIDTFSKKHTIDCFIIGSSIADYGIDVKTLETTLEKQGLQYTCFNWGFEYMMMQTTAKSYNMLIHEYHPHLIILGTSAVDFDPNVDKIRWITESPWMQYKLGRLSTRGWLANKSFIYQGLLAMPLWRQNTYWKEFEQAQIEIDPLGWRRKQSYYDMDTWLEKARINQPLRLKDYQMNLADIEGLKSILASQKNDGVKIIVIEMPLYTSYVPMYIQGGETTYEKEFRAPLRQITTTYNTPFIEGRKFEQSIAKDDWKDGFHLGPTGATLFTQWAAAQIATLYQISCDNSIPSTP